MYRSLLLCCEVSCACLVIFFASIVYSQDGPIVEVAQGLVRGTVNTTDSGRTFYSFRGIPYAQPPVGELRFQAPVPGVAWNGTFDATHEGPICMQFLMGQEDCLTINVYSSQLPKNDSNPFLPVMVFIHGGGFSSGNVLSITYGPQRFMEKDIVLCLMTYRLGPFGFLSTGDGAASGNFGLLDQALALQWVQNNIASFGGDANQVTVFGESAGSASVAYHILSPVSKGYFRAAIGESGSALNGWALQKDPIVWAHALADKLQCPTTNSTEMVDCLRQQQAEDLVAAAFSLGEYDVMIQPFVPVIEDPETGKFITELPLKILQSGNFNKVPLITGVNKDEGDLTYSMTRQYYTTIDDYFFQHTLPVLLHFLTKYDHNLLNVSYAVKEEYYDGIDVNNSTQVARASIDMNSDAAFKAPNDLFVRQLAANGVPVYMYVFEYVGSSSVFNFTGEGEVSHSDELAYLFDTIPLNDEDLQVSSELIDMWTNFASELNPTPSGDVKWTPSPPDEIQYLRIDTDLTMHTGYRNETMYFWNHIVPSIVYSFDEIN